MYESFDARPGRSLPFWSPRRIAALATALILLLTGVVGTAIQIFAVERFPTEMGRSSYGEALPDENSAASEPALSFEELRTEALQAYLALLTEKRDAVEGYYWQKGYTRYGALDEENTPRPVALADCWGDGIPELIYVDVDPASDYVYLSTLHIVTWDGSLKTLYEGDWDVMAGGGFHYCLFQTFDGKELFAWTSTGDESWTVRWDRFEEQGAYLVRVPVLQEEERFRYQDGSYDYETTYTVDGVEADEETYNDAVDAMHERILSVLMSSKNTDAFTEAFLETNGELGMTASEALFRLVEETLPISGERDVDPDAMPDGMTSFLLQFVGWYSDGNGGQEFHAQTAGLDGTNLLASMIHNGSCVRYRLYPGEGQTDYWGESDPRGWCKENDSYGSYASFDAGSVDWIAVNIFHISAGDLLLLTHEGEAAHQFYRQSAENGKDYYYCSIGGVGDPFLTVFPTSVKWKDGVYTVVYNVYFDTDWSSRFPSSGAEFQYTACAVLGYEEVDGVKYWTMYENSAELPDPDPPEPDPELFARIPSRYSFASGMGAWSTTLVLAEDGSFRGRFQDNNMGESGEGYDGTMYYSDFTGRFANPRRIDRYTWAFDLEELTYTGTPGDEAVEDFSYGRTRTVFTEAGGVAGGETFYYFEKGAPTCLLPKNYLQWTYAYGGDSDRLARSGLYNETMAQGFAAIGDTGRYETWSGAFEAFVMNGTFYNDGDLALGYGNAAESPLSFALHDADRDGAPELYLFNGQEALSRQATYVFAFRNGRVRFAEALAGNALEAQGLADEALTYLEVKTVGWQRFAAGWYGGEGGKVRQIDVPDDQGRTGLDWGWDLFREDPASFSKPLAEAGALLCQDPKRAEAALAALGFDRVVTAYASTGAAMTFGSRLLRRGGEERIVAAAVLTIPDESWSWGVADLGSWFPEETRTTAEEARQQLKVYLDSLEADFVTEPTVFYLTGYSMGGAAAAQLWPLLLEDAADADSLYVYTYGCLGYDPAPEETQAPFQHNLLFSDDLLAALLPGFGRAGQDHWLDGSALTVPENHSLRTLRERLRLGGIPETLPEGTGRYTRFTLPNRGNLVFGYPDAVYFSLHLAREGDGGLSFSSASAGPYGADYFPGFLVTADEENAVVLARQGCESFLGLFLNSEAKVSFLREEVDAVKGTVKTTARGTGILLRPLERLCFPMTPGAPDQAAAFLTGESGRTATRFYADGSSEKTLFDSAALGWIFVGLTVLGLVGLVLSLVLRRRRG